MPGELDQGGAHSPVGAVHQDGLAGLHPGRAVQHLPRGQAVDDERLGLGGVQAGGHRDQVRRGQQGVTGPAPGLGQGGDPLADQRRVDVRADAGDGADQVVAGHEREFRRTGITPAAHGLLGERHPAGLNGNQGLTGRGSGQRPGSGSAGRRVR